MFVSQAGMGAQGEDGGTGNWRGMLKKEDGLQDDRAKLQASQPASPQKGHAVNLLDVVGWMSLLKPLCTHVKCVPSPKKEGIANC